jgi:alpha-glucosidase
MHEQENVFTHSIQEVFTFGDKILVAPITDQGAVSKIVYLPAGCWYNYWTHEIIKGGREHLVPAALDSMPLFVKAGSVIPEAPIMQYVGEFEPVEMTYQIYFSEYEVSSLSFEDHDETFAYEQNIFLEKKFIVKGDAKVLHISQTMQGLFNPLYSSYDLKIIGLPFIPSKILIDGIVLQGELFFDELKQLRIKCNKNFKNIDINS